MSTEARTSIASHRRLAGSTVLLMSSKLDGAAHLRHSLDVAMALKRAGARAMIAAPDESAPAPLAAAGVEWIPFHSPAANIFAMRRSARRLEMILTSERVDIVHAHSAAAAWCALAATEGLPVWLVTTLPEALPSKWSPSGQFQSSLGRGDFVISHSSCAAGPMIRRFNIPSERVTIIPHPVDANLFDPATMRPERVVALRQAWRVPKGDRVVLVPGPIAPSGGHDVLVSAARKLSPKLLSGVTFMLMGDSGENARFARKLAQYVQRVGLDRTVRFAGPCRDWPAAIAASDLVVMPTTEALLYGRPIPESQAMARPVIASAIGILPENLLAPPRIPESLRTGWLVRPGDAADLSNALNQALSLDIAGYRALVARARQFAEFMFSPQNTVASVLGVYSRLLSGQGK
jgi:glycosyltransferase involved in cell wall biosynthesis